MTPRILSTAWFVVFASLTAPSYAAEPEFKAGLVTEARTYYREECCVGGNPATGIPSLLRVQIERVTVALEGERITGEWKAGPVLSGFRVSTTRYLAKDFPFDADVQATVRGNELRLIHPDGTVVRARIVDRVNSAEDESERD
jgi:hypothetical protein